MFDKLFESTNIAITVQDWGGTVEEAGQCHTMGHRFTWNGTVVHCVLEHHLTLVECVVLGPWQTTNTGVELFEILRWTVGDTVGFRNCRGCRWHVVATATIAFVAVRTSNLYGSHRKRNLGQQLTNGEQNNQWTGLLHLRRCTFRDNDTIFIYDFEMKTCS